MFVVAGGAGDTEEMVEYGRVGFQRLARRIMHDRAAFQYHDAVSQAQNLSRILLDDDGTNAARPRNLADHKLFFLVGQGNRASESTGLLKLMISNKSKISEFGNGAHWVLYQIFKHWKTMSIIRLENLQAQPHEKR